MSEHPNLRVRLTVAQRRAFNKGNNFMLSHGQLANTADDDDEDHVISMTGGALHRAFRAYKRNAGFRFQTGDIQGGDLFKKIGRFAKKAASYTKKHAGQWIEDAKKAVPKGAARDALHAGILAALTAAGVPPSAAGPALSVADSALNVAYKHDFRKPLNTLPGDIVDEAQAQSGLGIGGFFKKAGRSIQHAIKPAEKALVANKGLILKTIGATAVSALPAPLQPVAQLGVNAGVNAAIGGSIRPIGGGSIQPIGGGRIKMVKGSPEAMAWAARMRAARAAKKR